MKYMRNKEQRKRIKKKKRKNKKDSLEIKIVHIKMLLAMYIQLHGTLHRCILQL